VKISSTVLNQVAFPGTYSCSCKFKKSMFVSDFIPAPGHFDSISNEILYALSNRIFAWYIRATVPKN